jgi:hypothetical protein
VCRLPGSLLRFGRIVHEIYPLLSSLPLAVPEMLVPPSTGQEVPELDMNYCDPRRHSLSTIPASTRPSLASAHAARAVAFPASMLQSTSGIRVGPHRVRTTAQRLWLWGSLQRTVVPRGESLELSRDLGFPRVPRYPGFPSSACRITAASLALLCRTGSTVAIWPRCEICTRFHSCQVRIRSRGRPFSSSSSTSAARRKAEAGRTEQCSSERP